VSCFHRGPTFGEHVGTLLSQGLRGKGKISLVREIFYEEFERYVKKALLMGSSLHRARVGEPGRGSYTGTFERKRKCIFQFLFLDPEDFKV